MISADLFREVRPEFLRLLGTPAVRVYLDAADALEAESAMRSGALVRDEALAIVERAVERHLDVEIEGAAGDLPVRERARFVMERLVQCGWLAADDRTDYRRFILVEPNAALMLEVLRKMAWPGATVFSDDLVAACNLLHNTDAVRAEPWQTVEKCLESVRRGIQELRAVAKSVERHTRHQLEAQSLRENLEVVFDRYAEQVGRGAYSELVRARLPTRLPAAREAVLKMQSDADLLQRMAAEIQRREEGVEAVTATARALNRLEELAEALDRVVPAAEEVDRRTADFTRKSLARFRYLQEVTGERRAAVQGFFEAINARFAGRRIVDAEAGDVPGLLLSEAKILGGLESLYPVRLRHALGEVEALDDEISADHLDRSRRQLTATLRDSLTVARANRFAGEAFERFGGRVASGELLRCDDDLADLIACLLHAGAREAKFRVDLDRDLEVAEADRRRLDPVLGGTRLLERFELVKK